MITQVSLSPDLSGSAAALPPVQTAREMKQSWLAPLFLLLYRMLNCRRRRHIGRLVLMAVIRLEGKMSSRTAQKIMREFHRVEIGDFSYGGCFDPTVIPAGITIGRYVSVANGVRIFLNNHPLDRLSTHPFFYEVEHGDDLPPGRLDVGHDVWIGCNAIITDGCHRIGNGAVIGAGAVVTKDVPDFSIVAGNPARHIRDRFPADVIETLQASQWWLLSYQDLQPLLPELQRLLRSDSTADHSESQSVCAQEHMSSR